MSWDATATTDNGGAQLDAGSHVGEHRPEHFAGVDRGGEKVMA